MRGKGFMAISLLRLPAVIERTGYRRSTLYQKIKRGEFPAPIALGPRAVAWPSEDIDRWINERIAAGRRGADLTGSR
jgi:prophage regulatory protein